MPDNSKDYYKILGLNENATNEEIKQAFHNLAFKCHPDRPGGDEKRFKEINEAYQTLSNPNKKQQYDNMRKFGSNGFDGFNWSDASYGNASDFSSFSGFNDIFGSFFNSSFSQQPNRGNSNPNEDLEIKILISLKESFIGAKKEIKYQRSVLCDSCNGKGYPDNAQLKTCKTCNGKGFVEQRRSIPLFGVISEKVVCHECNGEGNIPDKKCNACNAKGFVTEVKTETIDIPAGIRNGDVLELKNYGDQKSKKFKAGNLYIKVLVKEDSKFWREGDNLFVNAHINVAEATLGVKKGIQNINEKEIIIDIPKGIDNGTILKVKGKGFKKLNQNSFGDLLVIVKIDTPKKLSKHAEELFKKLKEELG